MLANYSIKPCVTPWQMPISSATGYSCARNPSSARRGNLLVLATRQAIDAKILSILRDEMDKIGGQKISMPVIHPAEAWKETGRWHQIGSEKRCLAYGPSLPRLKLKLQTKLFPSSTMVKGYQST